MTVILRNKKWKDKLASMPESGMGYQIVNIKLKNGITIKGAKVFNGEELELPLGSDYSEYFSEDIIDDIELAN